jgi:hypothetical protein
MPSPALARMIGKSETVSVSGSGRKRNKRPRSGGARDSWQQHPGAEASPVFGLVGQPDGGAGNIGFWIPNGRSDMEAKQLVTLFHRQSRPFDMRLERQSDIPYS